MSTQPMGTETTGRHPRDTPIAWQPDPAWGATQMAATDRAKDALGIVIRDLERGRAVLEMTVRAEMANGFGITHGGMVFALADTAFAYACNEGGAPVVASGADIVFAKPSREGDTLTATATRRWCSGRNGVYDVTVTDQRGGRRRRVPGPVVHHERPPSGSTRRGAGAEAGMSVSRRRGGE